MTFLLTVFFFLLIIGFLIFIHELGHFMAAKFSGVEVKEFAIGFGNTIFSKTYKGTKYSINLIPMGGFVQLEGEEENTGPNSFRAKSFPVKFFILVAGVTMNLITAIVFFTIYLALFNYRFPIPKIADHTFTNTKFQEDYYPIFIVDDMLWGKEISEDENIAIVEINGKKVTSDKDFYRTVYQNIDKETEITFFNLDNFETYKQTQLITNVDNNNFDVQVTTLVKGNNQLTLGDKIIAINEEHLDNEFEFFGLIYELQGKEVNFTFKDAEGNTYDKNIKLNNEAADGSILNAGVNYDPEIAISTGDSDKQTYFIVYNKNILSGASVTYDMFVYQFKVLGSLFKEAFETGDYSEVSQSIGGLPILGEEVNNVVEYREFSFLIPLTAIISLSLATVNLLPLPALDGGQIFLSFIETVTRRKIPDSIVNKINLFGFVFLISLSIVITFKDIVQLGWLKSFEDFIQNVLGK